MLKNKIEELINKKIMISNETLLALSFCLPIFFSNLSEILLAFGFSSFTILSYIILYLINITLFFKLLIKKPIKTISVIFVFGLIILFSCIISNDVIGYIFNFGNKNIESILQSNIILFITRCLIPFIAFINKIDVYKFTNLLTKYSFILVIIYIIMNVVNFSKYNYATNYMNNAYMAFIPVALVYGNSFVNKKLFKYFLSIFAGFFVIISGSRGAALCMIGFIGIYHIIIGKFTYRKFILSLSLILCFAILILNLENILYFLSNTFEKIGISTRLIDLFNGKEEGVFQLSGRDKIYNNVIHEINFFGSGLFYDRVIMSGVYVHNLLIEVILNFGYFFGTLILILFFIKTAKSIFIIHNKPIISIWAPIIIIIFGIKYMVSGSYLISQDFWFLIGIVFFLK